MGKWPGLQILLLHVLFEQLLVPSPHRVNFIKFKAKQLNVNLTVKWLSEAFYLQAEYNFKTKYEKCFLEACEHQHSSPPPSSVLFTACTWVHFSIELGVRSPSWAVMQGQAGAVLWSMCALLQGCCFSNRPQLAQLWLLLAKGGALWLPKAPEVDKGRVQQPSYLCDWKWDIRERSHRSQWHLANTLPSELH